MSIAHHCVIVFIEVQGKIIGYVRSARRAVIQNGTLLGAAVNLHPGGHSPGGAAGRQFRCITGDIVIHSVET